MRLALFFALFLSISCGSREPKEEVKARAPEPAAAPAPAPPPVNDARPVIVAYGDSLSAGFGVPAGESFPDFLQKELDRQGYAYRVVNEGISGDTTSGGLARLDTVLARKPEIAILELGGNDGLRGLPLRTTRQNLEAMIQGLRKAGVKVLLAGMTLPPNYGPDYVKQFEQIYVELAATYKLPRIPFLLEGVATVPGLMQQDGIHPTTEGNRRVAALVMKYLKPMLEKPAK
ncbi:MAG: arylesterase [Bryobacteraceae bacterium]|nr:arylesterase [Bryobacteraceae bacterium]